jgi:hypothetical protein
MKKCGKRKTESLRISETKKLEPEEAYYCTESSATLPYKSSRGFKM